MIGEEVGQEVGGILLKDDTTREGRMVALVVEEGMEASLGAQDRGDGLRMDYCLGVTGIK